MTLNDSWGYQHADDNWKTPKLIIRNLISCVRDEGNYLLNIGPKADGSIPEESVRVLSEVGQWMARNREAIYQSEVCQVRRNNYASFIRKGNTLYMHVHYWAGDTVAMSGLQTKVKSARLLANDKKVEFQQDPYRIRLTGLPVEAPVHPVTTIAMECESEPTQDSIFVREEKPREGVYPPTLNSDSHFADAIEADPHAGGGARGSSARPQNCALESFLRAHCRVTLTTSTGKTSGRSPLLRKANAWQ